MSTRDEKILELLTKLHEKTTQVETNTKIQAEKISSLNEKVEDIKQEQIRQNQVVTDHERRSVASEARLNIVEDQHKTFKKEHEEFKKRIIVAEQPGLVLKNVWRALLTLGAGAGAMLGILKFLDYLK